MSQIITSLQSKYNSSVVVKFNKKNLKIKITM